jgi:DNA polymerase (family 10)
VEKAAQEKPAVIMDPFSDLGETIARGDTKCSVKLPGALQADLRLVPAESFGAALQYFTGSRAHNVALRTLAVSRKLSINEYGIFKTKADGTHGKRLGGSKEEEIYGALGMAWIPPELRENRGEIEAAMEDRIPRLLEREDLRGDVHMHTTETDGSATVEEMARAAIDRGRSYIAIADHSKALAMTGGLDEKRLAAQGRVIDRVNASLGDRIRVLRGIEVDILRDGQLDLKEEALRRLDVVVASVHSHFNLPREEMTARVIRAMDSGCVDILAHPTGRLLLRREPYQLDMEAVMKAAATRGVALELNAFPDRLDLSDTHCRMARDIGVKVVISTDSHTTEHLDLLRFGVGQARRGWLRAEDVLNTLEVDAFLKNLHAGHR